MGKSGSGLGSGARPSDDKHYFGTDAELNQRNKPGIGSLDPQANTPHFVQTPTANTGKNMNDPQIDNKSGNFKFSKGV